MPSVVRIDRAAGRPQPGARRFVAGRVLDPGEPVGKDRPVRTAQDHRAETCTDRARRGVGLLLRAGAAAGIGLAIVAAPAAATAVPVGAAGTAVPAPAGGGVRVERLAAESPMTLTADITDPQGVLGAQKTAVRAALDALTDNSDLRLYVVYVPSFDGQQGIEWANATAGASSLGAKDLLLAVATSDHTYGLSWDNKCGLSSGQIDGILAAVAQELRNERWAAAAITAADLAREDATGGGGPNLGLILGGGAALIAVAGAGAVLVTRARRRSAVRSAAGGPDSMNALSSASTADLNARAGAALVAIDDAVRTSEQELGFAEAQFGFEATVPFRHALADAKTRVAHSFELRHQLEDADVPEPQARTMMARIITTCAEVEASLDVQSDSFDQLRNLHADAPQLMTSLEQRVSEVRGQIEPARAGLVGLRATYSPGALASVLHNPEQAAALLENADEALTHGHGALARKDRGQAVAFARAAENAIGQAAKLLDQVRSVGAELAGAGARIDKGLASITADVQDAARIAPPSGPVGAAVAEAQGAITQARTARTSPNDDPLAALRRLTEAENALDEALAPFRAQAEQAARANALLRETIGRVDSQIRATNAYIDTRRGAVGPEARTKLAEAIRILDEARMLQPTDPAQALGRAQEADGLAHAAAELARQDTSSFDVGRGVGSAGGTNVGGMVLGGILLDSVLRGGFGGGFGGGGFGGGGSAGGGRSAAGGSFGGGRSGGGRSAAGGRF